MMACGWGVQFFSIVKSAGAFTIINQILFILCIDGKDKMGTREVEELIAPGSLGSGFFVVAAPRSNRHRAVWRRPPAAGTRKRSHDKSPEPPKPPGHGAGRRIAPGSRRPQSAHADRIQRRRASGLGDWRAYAASTASGAGRSGRRATAIRSIPHPWATAENRIRMV